jgi:hypothetical protein
MLRTEPALSASTHLQGATSPSRPFPARKPCQSVRRIDFHSATRLRARAAVAPEAAAPDPLYLSLLRPQVAQLGRHRSRLGTR